MNKKYAGLIVVIIVVIGIIYGLSHKKQAQENKEIVSDTMPKIVTEVCKVDSKVESDWCKLPTGQRLMLGMTGDTVYDNGDYYSFSRNNIDQNVRLYKTETFTCAVHPEALSCNDATKFILIGSGSKDFYNSILKQLNDSYLQTKKGTDPQ